MVFPGTVFTVLNALCAAATTGDRAPPIVYCFLPLAHRGGLNNLTMTLRVGGSLSFLSQSDMSTLFDDVRIGNHRMTCIARCAGFISHLCYPDSYVS